MSGKLVIYYSRKGQNYFGGSIRSIPKGNTEFIAEYIRDSMEADMFQIETVNEYPADYHECTEVAQQELRQKARPKLKDYLDSVDGYSDIFICGPCWWGTYPMAVFSQLEKLDWTGKRIYAVMTHEGSGLGGSEKDLQRICTGAELRDSLAISGSSAESSAGKVSSWAKKAVL